MICWKCIEDIGNKRICPYCGYDQFEDYPSLEESKKIIEDFIKKNAPTRNESILEPMFTDEERLALGLYPQNEDYKMALITKILYKD